MILRFAIDHLRASRVVECTAAFVRRLRELGWIEGCTVAIEYRWAEGASASPNSIDTVSAQNAMVRYQSRAHREFTIGREAVSEVRPQGAL
jgi:hypothetical protein